MILSACRSVTAFFFLLIAAFISLPAIAGEVTRPPVVTFTLMGSSLTFSSLSELISNVNQTQEENFNNCTQAPVYSCTKMVITGSEPSPNAGLINGVHTWYQLPRNSHSQSKDTQGNVNTYSREDVGDLGATVSFTCPKGYSAQTEGPTDDRTMECVKVENEECDDLKEGNPINITTGNKSELEIDYSSADGLLNIERRFINQNNGWTIDEVPRLIPVAPGQTASTQGTLNGGMRDACPDVSILTRSQYAAEGSNPFATATKIEWVCPELINDTTDTHVHLWMNGRHTRFTGSGSTFTADGMMSFRSTLTTISGSNGEAWKLVLSSGVYYFDSNGYLLHQEPASGGNLTYTWGTHGLASKTDHAGRTLTYGYDTDGRMTSITLPDNNQVTYEYVSDTDPESLEFWLLERVTWPDGSYIEYLYNESAHLGSGTPSPISLTGKIDGKGERIGTYKYSNGKATSTEGALGANKRVIQNYSSFAYVTDAIGTRRTIYFQKSLPDGSKLKTGTNQPAGSGSASATSNAQYYNDGLLKEHRDFNGNKTLYGYDHVRGLKVVQVEGVSTYNSIDYRLPGTTLPAGVTKTSFDWHATWRKPARKAEPGLLTTYVYNGDADPFNNNVPANCSSATLDGQPLPALCRVVQQATTDTNGSQGFNVTLDTTATAQHYTYTYNSRGQLLSETHSPSQTPTRTIEYYETTGTNYRVGDIYRITNALGHQATFHEYSANGYPERITDANGVEILLGYDTRNRLTSQSVNGAVTTHQYDENGNRSQSQLPNGVTVNYEYDAAHRLVGIEDSSGNSIEYELDAEGNLLFERIRDTNGTLTYVREQIMDALSRVMQVKDGYGNISQYTYDKNDNLTSVTDARQNVTSHNYDRHDNQVLTTDALSGEVDVAYDGQQRIISVTDQNGNETTYTYNGLGQLVELDSPDTGVTTYTYDAQGNRSSATDARGITVQYQYDALNRLTTVTYPASTTENVTYVYDDTTQGSYQLGRLSRIDFNSGSIRYYYDAHGQITQEVHALSGVNYTTSYAYDAAGQLTDMTYPSGLAVHYDYNAAGQVELVTASYQGPGDTTTQQWTIAENIAYLPYGPMKSLDYGNGAQLVRQFDLNYRLDNAILNTSLGQPLLSHDYDYDAVGNITDRLDLINSSASQTFDYDALDRLDYEHSDAYDNTHIGYDYDPVGNRTTKTYTDANAVQQSDTLTYETGSNRMATRETGAVVLDAPGNTTAMSRRDSVGNLVDFTFTYNHGGRRMSTTGVHDLTDPQTSQARDISATYTYNPLGQRIFKAVQVIDQPGTPQAAYNWASNRFHYDPEGHLLADVESLDNGTSVTDTTRQWIYLNGVPIAQVTDAEDASGNPLPSRLTWFYNDHLGVARAGMNANEAIIWQIEAMTGFGDDIQIQSMVDNGITLVNPLRFPGQYSDRETGLSYNYFRTYDPDLGRYLESDPIGIIKNYSDPRLKAALKENQLEPTFLMGKLNQPYGYVEQNPTNYIDPTGLAPKLKRPKLVKDQCRMDCQTLQQELITACKATGFMFFSCKAEVDQLIVECIVNKKMPPECNDPCQD